MLAGQPVIILKENVERTRGHEAQRTNIMAARAISAAVRSTLGPRGMDKMIVSSTGDVVVTNDGATILHELSVQHPGAKMVVEVAEAQDDEVGDGTTTACILVGVLMEEAERMLYQGIHPTIIAQGFRMGMDRAMEVLQDLAIAVDPNDRETLLKMADTAMTGKAVEAVKDKLNKIVVDAVTTVAEDLDGEIAVDEENVMIKKHTGETMDDAELVRGVIIDKTRMLDQMPQKVRNARVALISTPLEIVKGQVKAKIRIKSADQMSAFGAQERETLKEMADRIIESGANVVLCQKGIDDAVAYYLGKSGVFAVQDIPEKDMKYAARALCANIVNKPDELRLEDLGTAELVEELEDAELVKISGCQNPKTVTILLWGSTQVLIDELERAVYDGVRVIIDALEDGKLVVGGGAVESELFLNLRDYATTVGGRTQIAIEAFASAFESIPKQLAENSGYNPIDKVVDLRTAHARGDKHAGLNVYTGKIVNMRDAGVLEPLRVKTQAIQSATEASTMLIRVDDMMVSQRREGPAAPPAPMG